MQRLRIEKAALLAGLWLVFCTGAHAQTYSKTEVITYHDDLALWVLGQVGRSTTNGIETTRIDYGWKALPWKTYRFGKLQQIFSYNTTDGTLKSVTDGRGNITTLSNWKRGIPQTIGYPATPDQPSGESESAVVNNDGTIASTTDENGYRTCYAYDPMGRLSRITYPSETQTGVCDASAWSPTTISFQDGYPAARGLPAGHWRQYVETGNGRKVVLFDALWRPVIEQAYDKTSSGTVSATLSEVAKRYDADGRLVFRSYPSNVAINFTNPNLEGTHTTYDALDRVRTVTQDSEIGPLVTITEYLSGFQTRLTNPRGEKTTTAYLAWDQPTRDYPTSIDHPGDAITLINRDAFGKPNWMQRRNAGASIYATRRFVYDTYQRLCKTIEPETGSTLMTYDAADNLAWTASGLDLTSTTYCQISDPSVAARKVYRTYDARNRILSLVFPDHRGDTTYHYMPDSKLASITSDNDGTNQVTTQYAYNRRRLMTEERMLWNNINWPINYTYDANGHLASQRLPVGWVVDYAPNALGQPTQAGSYASNVSYYPNGAIKQFTYGNGIVHTMTQNARQLPERSRDVYGGTVFHDDSYDYDKNGNVAGISDALPSHRGDRTMTYDALDRLTATVSPMFGTASYTYDVLDNLTRVKVTGGSQPRDHYYCYDSHWRLTNVKTGGCGGTTVIGLGYDVQGNLANKSGKAYDFDYGNRLRWAGGSPASSYVYDGHGRRVRDYAGASRYSQYSHTGQLVFTSDMRQNKWLGHIYLGGSLVAIRERDRATGTYTTKYQHTDALGSPVAVTSQARAVLERREYEPYGRELSTIADGVGYTGHVQDAATGLVYMQQRYYDPFLGRFLSVDPVTAYEKPLTNFNRYLYARNNPYKFTDPDGRDVTCDQSSCTIESNSILETVVDYGTVGIIYARRLIENAIVESQHNESVENNDSGNTNPYDGPVDEPVVVVDGDGNAIPVGEGEQVSSSPDGRYQQVKDSSGKPTGTRLDKGGHRGHADPKAQAPHGHRPGVTDETGNPHLPIEPPKPPPEDPSRGL